MQACYVSETSISETVAKGIITTDAHLPVAAKGAIVATDAHLSAARIQVHHIQWSAEIQCLSRGEGNTANN